VIEDERNLADAIVRGLRRVGLAVDVAYDGTSGHEMAFVTRYDVLVLDRDLPGKHGDEICADLVAAGVLTRVLMLTASDSVADRVEGLGLGADDYLPSRSPSTSWWPGYAPWAGAPHPPRRRYSRSPTCSSTRPGGGHRGGRPLELTRKEFGILEELIKAQGAVVSSEELLERVWDANVPTRSPRRYG